MIPENAPLVTVLLATHNGVAHICESLRSVLSQTYANLQIVIVDDASTDETKKIVTSINDRRIEVVSQPQQLGLTKSLNNGLRKARGKYIARIDDDDMWIMKDKLAQQVAFMEKHPRVGLCGTNYLVINERGSELIHLRWPTTDKGIRKMILKANPFGHSCVCIRREALDKVGGYDENVRFSQDYEMWLRIGKVYEFANLPVESVAKRVTTKAISSKHKLQQCLIALQITRKYRASYPGYVESAINQLKELLITAVLPRQIYWYLVSTKQKLFS